MKLCRFNSNQLGVVQGDEIVDVSRALDVIPAVRYPLPVSDPMILHFDEVRARINQLLPSAPEMGWCPPAGSITDRRRIPMPQAPSTWRPWSSGPRWAIASPIRDRSSGSTGRASNRNRP